MKALNYDSFMNPNKGNASFNLNPKLKEYKELYHTLYAKDTTVACVYIPRTDRYTFFFKLTSQENDKYPTPIMYDVIIEFDPPKNMKSVKNNSDLQQYDVYVYSNSPGFVFTFDYVIKHQHGFPHCLPNRYLSQIAITKAPEVRNRYEIMTMEKTTWMAFYHLVHNGYLTKESLKPLITGKNENYYLRQVETQPQKLKEIKELQKIMRDEREKARLKQKANSKDYHKESNKPNTLSANFTFNTKNNNILKSISNHNSKFINNAKKLFRFH